MTDLLYIGGYGHSGSTLLESLLATRSNVLACGEVACCLRDRVERPCTCGKTRYECEVWSPFYRTRGPLRGWTHETLTLALIDRAPAHYRLLVDSSKTAWGTLTAPFKLRRTLGPRFRLVHVVRNPRGVCWSTAGRAWKRRAVIANLYLRHLRTALGWWTANLSCELFRRLYPTQYVQVRYEDLARSHETVLQRLFADVLPEESGSGPAGGATPNRHQLYGNQRRYKGFEPSEVSEDIRWKSEMPAGQQAFVSTLTWPLRLRYGY